MSRGRTRTHHKRPLGARSIEELRFRIVLSSTGVLHGAVLQAIALCGAQCRHWIEAGPEGDDLTCVVCQKIVDVVCDEYEAA